MRIIITLLLFITVQFAFGQTSSSSVYTKQQLQEALTGSRDIRFWTYQHKQGSTNLAQRGIRLDSLFSVLEDLGISGGGTGTVVAYYQNVQNNGAATVQRPTLNFKSGNSNATVTAVDNSASNRTDVTVTIPGGTVNSLSDAIVVINGTGSAVKPFSVQFIPSSVDINDLAGPLNLTGLAQAGATIGQVPIWTSSGWVPGTLGSGGTTYVAGTGIMIEGNVIVNTGDQNANDDVLVTSNFGGDVSGTYNNLQIVPGAIGPTELSQMGASTGQVLKWNGTAWVPSTDLSSGGSAPEHITAASGYTVTVSGTLPTDLTKIQLYRTGVRMRIGSGKDAIINTLTGVITFSTPLIAEDVTVYY